MIDTVKLQKQRQAMERERFGATRSEILAAKGAKCVMCGSTYDLVIDHKSGGGRHATENGMIVAGKTHNLDNLQVLCRSCAGKKDRMRNMRGLGIEGNSNNPSQ
jgi:5-methylcytosine-specific restriction endonuclease McrA